MTRHLFPSSDDAADLAEALRDGGRRRYTRREVLAGSLRVGASLTIGGLLAACGIKPAPSPTDGFARLSEVLTGTTDLPKKLGRKYLDALAHAGLELSPQRLVSLAGYDRGAGPADLGSLQRSPAMADDGAQETARAIAGAWWSGMVPTRDGGQKVVAYEEALVWRAMPWAHAPTQCLGATGAWAEAGGMAS